MCCACSLDTLMTVAPTLPSSIPGHPDDRGPHAAFTRPGTPNTVAPTLPLPIPGYPDDRGDPTLPTPVPGHPDDHGPRDAHTHHRTLSIISPSSCKAAGAVVLLGCRRNCGKHMKNASSFHPLHRLTEKSLRICTQKEFLRKE